MLPCPAPRVRFADSENISTEDRKRRRPADTLDGSSSNDVAKEVSSNASMTEEEKMLLRKMLHECPVPKPNVLIGQVLGFEVKTAGQPSRPRIETASSPKTRKELG